jgi:alpha-L-fucosidase 2
LLIEPSASPEQVVRDPQTIEGKPGQIVGGRYYMTTGTTFDQGFVWENHNDVLTAAAVLGYCDPFLEKINNQIGSLDPILIGDSGQIKEFREETVYSEIGDPKHRHISHLCPLYPGTLINSKKPEWMRAASKTLDLRGYRTSGWGMAHRMNCRARLKEGEKAYHVYQAFIVDKVAPNLWSLHPPFQIDGNLGVTAGVAEMLLQSHEGFIDILPALPKAWNDGQFKGLVARGNFSCSVKWANGQASQIVITSRSGLECSLHYENIGNASVTDLQGKPLIPQKIHQDLICFPTQEGASYTIRL